ncbi:hypothetical protein CHU98_g4903 [Xylaria longipes]|nr:hypothetical protein CHU98_g4903 [Xylaria longipes]
MCRPLHLIIVSIAFPVHSVKCATPGTEHIRLTARSSSRAAEECKTFPGDANWPSESEWARLNASIDGVLLNPKPAASPCYPGPDHDEDRCQFLVNGASSTRFWLDEPLTELTQWTQGSSCVATLAPVGNCTRGGFPEYVVNATTAKHVQFAVNFARDNNIRLVIKNTGHDFGGRSVGAGSISVWTHYLKSTEFIRSYKIGQYSGMAVRIGSGVEAWEVSNLMAANNITIVAAGCNTVGGSGGWLSSGGHSTVTSTFGLGADQALSLEVVTADGKLVTANPLTNQDLFWAMRGGGGVMKAYPPISISSSSLSFIVSSGSTTGAVHDVETFWQGVASYYKFAAKILDAGGYGFSYIYPMENNTYRFTTSSSFPGMAATAAFNFMQPLFDTLKAVGVNVANPTIGSARPYGSPRGGTGDRPVNTRYRSRLLPRENWENDNLFNQTMRAIRTAVEGGFENNFYFHGTLTSPTEQVAGWPGSDSAVNPAWRKNRMHAMLMDVQPDGLTAQQATDRDTLMQGYMSLLRDVSPGAGSYMNEGDPGEPNWQQAFFGANYERLLEIKRKWDPTGVFWAPTTVGSEDWAVKVVDGGMYHGSGAAPIRIANCSGATPDPGDLMLTQATAGPVDVITGDYLAEANLAQYAEAYAKGEHPGYVASAYNGLQLSLEAINEKRIKVVINGGGLNPKGLAEAVHKTVNNRGYNLKIAYVEGDDLLPVVHDIVKPDGSGQLPHFDSTNNEVKLAKDTDNFLQDPNKRIVAANAYLGCRAIRFGLEHGADIIICGRVADASPVMGAAQWWHGWKDDDFDKLAGALVAGHLIECSTYGTGSNFAGFDRYTIQQLLHLGCPIAEIAENGEAVITKHEALNGVVTEEVVKCQLLYELQGNIYLNSDVKADITNVAVRQVGPNRVHVSGAKGHPPPPTTKLAVFYRCGWQGEHTINATGYAMKHKYDLQEAQMRTQLEEWGVMKDIDLLEFQRIGVPQENPRSQSAATTYLRIFVQTQRAEIVRQVHRAFWYNFMQHSAGLNGTFDTRLLAIPIPFLGYFPALVAQNRIEESVSIIGQKGEVEARLVVGPPRTMEELAPRENYDPMSPHALSSFGLSRSIPFGDIILARSGDKGANVNVGFTPRKAYDTAEVWEWLRSFLTRDKLKELMGDDWQDWFHVERVEFPKIRAVHFVVYGALGRGVSSSARLDSLGKGFAEWLRAVHVPVPVKFLERRHMSKI